MKQRLMIQSYPNCIPEIGAALGMLQDARQLTLTELQGVNKRAVDWIGGLHRHSIGTLLYHIAVIEISWVAGDIAPEGFSSDLWQHYPYQVRSGGKLTVVSGIRLEEHLKRLAFTREQLLKVYPPMTLADYRDPRSMSEYS